MRERNTCIVYFYGDDLNFFHLVFVILLPNKVYMPYDIKELLKLPDEEKIAIADLLYSSVNDDDFDEGEETKPWYEDEEFVKELDKRAKDWEEGKVKGIPWEEVKTKILNSPIAGTDELN
jgi:putative addiction module component (TIGR02574 family)